ncbi:MAG: class I SAM-dependent RNA methyltransferase [Acidobacteriota bacterium]|nr:class I SAM-dependent RNA methyltransferase [Acidobacteriota bacterium]
MWDGNLNPSSRDVNSTDDLEPLPTLVVEIERLLPGGVGLAHAEGLTLFVSLAAPGDMVRVQIERRRGKVSFASIIEVIKPSPARVEPPCPYFGRCGGCDFQQLNYETQLQAKVEIIRDCLRRIANIADPPEIAIHPSPKQWQYRARANWQFDPHTRYLGYFEAGSHRVCDVEVCAVLVPDLQNTLEDLRAQIRNDSFPTVKNVEVVAGDEGVSMAPGGGGFATKNVSRRIGDEAYHFSADAFFQVNHELLEPLIHEAAGNARGAVAMDLYCGVGLFTVPLARGFERVVGVESNPTAARFARLNLRNAQLESARIITARVGEWLNSQSLESEAIDFLLLDPPRAGAENSVIKGILARRPRQISYVSCDPATLARDLKKLLAAGYFLDSVAAFDMFPQTHHVETVVRLAARF